MRKTCKLANHKALVSRLLFILTRCSRLVLSGTVVAACVTACGISPLEQCIWMTRHVECLCCCSKTLAGTGPTSPTLLLRASTAWYCLDRCCPTAYPCLCACRGAFSHFRQHSNVWHSTPQQNSWESTPLLRLPLHQPEAVWRRA